MKFCRKCWWNQRIDIPHSLDCDGQVIDAAAGVPRRRVKFVPTDADLLPLEDGDTFTAERIHWRTIGETAKRGY